MQMNAVAAAVAPQSQKTSGALGNCSDHVSHVCVARDE